MTYTAPNGGAYPLFDKLIEQTHVLIAGTTGSGKSVTENGILYNIVNQYTPDEAELYLIDPKRVELQEWRSLPHVRYYARTVEDAVDILDEVTERMMGRYATLERMNLKKWTGSHIFVLIDEMADLFDDGGREIIDRMKKILKLGRAANIHVIGCSQFAKKTVIPAIVIDNFTCRFGLRMLSDIASRQIIMKKGCEKLDEYGQAIVLWGNGMYEKVDVPMYTEAHYAAIRSYYSAQRFAIYKSESGV